MARTSAQRVEPARLLGAAAPQFRVLAEAAERVRLFPSEAKMALEPPLAGKAAVMVAAALPKLVFEVGEGRGIACHAVVLLMSQA